MQISLFQAILLGLYYYVTYLNSPFFFFLSAPTLKRPLVCGLVVGIILGDITQGIIIGTAIQIPYISFMAVGGSMPSDLGLAGILGTALAMASGADTSVAVTIAVSLGLVGSSLHTLRMSVCSIFLHMCDKAAEEGDLKKACFWHLVPPQIYLFIQCVGVVTIGAYFGSGIVISFIEAINGTPIITILSVIGGMLPALGIAITLQAMGGVQTILLYLLGFIMLKYMNMPVVAIAIVAGIFAYFVVQGLGGSAAQPAEAIDDGGEF